MPRGLLIGLLAFGTVAGFGSGFASLAHRMHGGWGHGCHARFGGPGHHFGWGSWRRGPDAVDRSGDAAAAVTGAAAAEVAGSASSATARSATVPVAATAPAMAAPIAVAAPAASTPAVAAPTIAAPVMASPVMASPVFAAPPVMQYPQMIPSPYAQPYAAPSSQPIIVTVPQAAAPQAGQAGQLQQPIHLNLTITPNGQVQTSAQ